MLDGLDELCTEALARHGCASVSVAVAERDEVVFTRAWGQADLATRRPATPETVYGLASVTKAFTATAVRLAAAEGLLDLDSPVPGRFDRGAPTPRQLLLHRGGLPAFYDFHYGTGPRPVRAERYRAQVRAPGTDFEYANLGYQELADLLERTTGRPFATFLRDRIATPLGLTGFTHGAAGPAPDSTAVATRYSAAGRAYPTCRTGHPAATAAWATAADIALFARTSARLVASAPEDAEPLNAHTGYGYGRLVSRGPGPLVLSHGGGMGGVAAMMIDFPEQEVSLAVLTNSTDKSTRDLVVRHLGTGLVPGFDPERHLDTGSDASRPADLPAGRWSGGITTPEGPVPLRLDLLPPDRVRIHLAGAPPITCGATASTRHDLQATAPLQLPTADARLNSPHLGLALGFRQGALTGRAVAYKPDDREGFLGSYLPHSCTLRPLDHG
ncbi:serine hydrolase domain-containing protein [Kitasatospora sp. NPDC096147]|uniref:serine hydrolase domain-containing protein n=1 Tax=Kitasatospora sp. NPDC096147 TaxID=3364093 RepID=UPI0038278328